MVEKALIAAFAVLMITIAAKVAVPMLVDVFAQVQCADAQGVCVVSK